MRVLTVGSFDPLHDGHRALFADMRKLASKDGAVIVGVNGDNFYTRYRGTAPYVPAAFRLLDVLAHGNGVDSAYINDARDLQAPLILAQRPDVLVVGLDWAHDGYLDQLNISSWEWFTDHRITVCFTPRHGTISSTELREAARRG